MYIIEIWNGGKSNKIYMSILTNEWENAIIGVSELYININLLRSRKYGYNKGL